MRRKKRGEAAAIKVRRKRSELASGVL